MLWGRFLHQHVSTWHSLRMLKNSKGYTPETEWRDHLKRDHSKSSFFTQDPNVSSTSSMRCACDVDCQLGQRRGCSTPAHQQNFIPTDLHSRCFFCISTPKRPQKCWPVKIWIFRCGCWKVCWFGFYGLESPHKFSRTVFRFAWAACDFQRHSTIG